MTETEPTICIWASVEIIKDHTTLFGIEIPKGTKATVQGTHRARVKQQYYWCDFTLGSIRYVALVQNEVLTE